MWLGVTIIVLSWLILQRSIEYLKLRSTMFQSALDARNLNVECSFGIVDVYMHSVDHHIQRWWNNQSRRKRWMHKLWYRAASIYGPIAMISVVFMLSANVVMMGTSLLSEAGAVPELEPKFSTNQGTQISNGDTTYPPLSANTVPVAGTGSFQIGLMLPGVTVPLSYVVYIAIALILNGVLHELGHGIAATIEGVPVFGFGIHVCAVYPGAYVDVDMDSLVEIVPSKQQRIYSAGIFNNLIIGIATFLLTVTVIPLSLSLCYVSGHGALVLNVRSSSPLSSLIIPSQHAIIGINSQSQSCVVSNVDDWMECLGSQFLKYESPPPSTINNGMQPWVPSSAQGTLSSSTDINSTPTMSTNHFPLTLPVQPRGQWGYCVSDDRIHDMRQPQQGQSNLGTQRKARSNKKIDSDTDLFNVFEKSGLQQNINPSNPAEDVVFKRTASDIVESGLHLRRETTDEAIIDCCASVSESTDSGDAYCFAYAPESLRAYSHSVPYDSSESRSGLDDMQKRNVPQEGYECLPARTTVDNIPCTSNIECTTFNVTDVSTLRCMVPLCLNPTIQLFKIEIVDVRYQSNAQYTTNRKSNYNNDKYTNQDKGNDGMHWESLSRRASFVVYEGSVQSLLHDLILDNHIPRSFLSGGDQFVSSVLEWTGVGQFVRLIPFHMYTFLQYLVDLSIGLSLFNAVPMYRLDGQRILEAFVNTIVGWGRIRGRGWAGRMSGEKTKTLVDLVLVVSTTVLGLNLLIIILSSIKQIYINVYRVVIYRVNLAIVSMLYALEFIMIRRNKTTELQSVNSAIELGNDRISRSPPRLMKADKGFDFDWMLITKGNNMAIDVEHITCPPSSSSKRRGSAVSWRSIDLNSVTESKPTHLESFDAQDTEDEYVHSGISKTTKFTSEDNEGGPKIVPLNASLRATGCDDNIGDYEYIQRKQCLHLSVSKQEDCYVNEKDNNYECSQEHKSERADMHVIGDGGVPLLYKDKASTEEEENTIVIIVENADKEKNKLHEIGTKTAGKKKKKDAKNGKKKRGSIWQGALKKFSLGSMFNNNASANQEEQMEIKDHLGIVKDLFISMASTSEIKISLAKLLLYKDTQDVKLRHQHAQSYNEINEAKYMLFYIKKSIEKHQFELENRKREEYEVSPAGRTKKREKIKTLARQHTHCVTASAAEFNKVTHFNRAGRAIRRGLHSLYGFLI
eukprot:CFRG0913T1